MHVQSIFVLQKRAVSVNEEMGNYQFRRNMNEYNYNCLWFVYLCVYIKIKICLNPEIRGNPLTRTGHKIVVVTSFHFIIYLAILK